MYDNPPKSIKIDQNRPTKIDPNQSKSIKINQNLLKSSKVEQNQIKSINIDENQTKSTESQKKQKKNKNEFKSIKTSPKMPQELPRSFQSRLKLCIFCFTARGWPVSPQALSIRPFPRGRPCQTSVMIALPRILNLQGLRAFRGAR